MTSQIASGEENDLKLELGEIKGYRMETFRSKYFITKIRRSTYTSI